MLSINRKLISSQFLRQAYSLPKKHGFGNAVFDMKNSFEQYPPVPECGMDSECKKLAKHYINIDIPVDVRSKADVGRIETECCGEPMVICTGEKKADTCHFVLVQKVCIRIPVEYKLAAKAEPSMVECCDKPEK